MSTGLHSKVEILIGGLVIDTKEFDDSVENLTIGSDSSSADICIDVDGVSSVHAVVTLGDGLALIMGIGGEAILVNGAPQDPNAPLKNGDEVQIGAATLRWHITDLQAEEVTDPGVAAAAPAASEAHQYWDEDEESEEYEDEDVLASIVEQIQSNTADANKPKTKLAIHQIFGSDVIAMKVFAPSQAGVSIGGELATRFRFVGTPVAWVPKAFGAFAWLMYPFTEANVESKNDFYSPSDTTEPLVNWNGNQPVCLINKSWTAWSFDQNGTTSLDDLKSQGKVREAGSGYEYDLPEQGGLIIQTGNLTFVANRTPEGQKITGAIASDIDYPFASLMSVLLLMFSFLTYYVLFLAPAPEVTDTELDEELFAELVLEEPPEPPEEEKKDANPDAGEGAKAKKEEGKVGKKDAKMKEAKGDKVEVDKRTKDKEVVDEFMSGLNFGANSDSGAMDGMGGIANLDANMQGGLGGVMGAKGVQAGSGGLGSSGGGLGGGGTADGVGGLGTKGSGRGSSGYGKGGGSVGKKRSGGSIKSGGTPIILGALDKSLIDAVIRKNMNQIRYCYQRELTKNPGLKGKIIVKFTIAADGSVSRASIKTSSMGNSAVEGCITGRFKRFKFPQPKGGGVVIVSYPFIFSS